jgi:hypothetical protein
LKIHGAQQLFCGLFRTPHPAAAGHHGGEAARARDMERPKLGFVGALKAGFACGRGLRAEQRLRGGLRAVLRKLDTVEHGTARKLVEQNGKAVALVECLQLLQHLPLLMRLRKPVRNDDAQKPQRTERQNEKDQIFHARSAHGGSSWWKIWVSGAMDTAESSCSKEVFGESVWIYPLVCRGRCPHRPAGKLRIRLGCI